VAKKTKLLSDLFHDTLKDVSFAENKILKTLPKMAKAAQSKDLKAAFVKDYKGMPALDAGLLAAAQAVEHYEMSRYGTLRAWAGELGMPDAVALLEATLKEEKATDAALTSLAKSVVNVEAEAEL
jgi:ferritin-like metal-binding protein YciE